MAEHYDELRKVFELHGVRTADGRPASDEEIEVALRAFLDAAAETGRRLNAVMKQAIIQLGRVARSLEEQYPLLRDVARQEQERADG